MTRTDTIENTTAMFVRADEVQVRDEVQVAGVQGGWTWKFVTGVIMVGDDIEVHGFDGEMFSTSVGNMVGVRRTRRTRNPHRA